MKFVKLFLVFFFMFSLCLFAQQDKENQKKNQTSPNTEKPQKENVLKEKKSKFIDLNGDGLNDNGKGMKMNKPKPGQDKFIDKDGDGFNDNRVKGMGWDNKGKRKPFGKHGR